MIGARFTQCDGNRDSVGPICKDRRSLLQIQQSQVAETRLLVDVGKTQREHVWIRFVDSAKSDWAMGGELQG